MTTKDDKTAQAAEEQTKTEQVTEEVTDKTEAELAAEAEGVTEAETAETEAEEQTEQEAPAKPKPGKTNPFRSRISELTTERKSLAEENAELRRQLSAKPAPKQEAEGEERTEAPEGYIPVSVATNLVQQEAQRIAAKNQFDNDCNAEFAKGAAAYEDFTDALENFKALGGLENDVVEDALATGEAAKVLYDLGNDPEAAARILKLPRAKRIAEFTRMTIKGAPAKTAVSRAAPPIKPVGGTAKKDFDPLDTSISDEEWHRQEDAREREKRRA